MMMMPSTGGERRVRKRRGREVRWAGRRLEGGEGDVDFLVSYAWGKGPALSLS
jgi:hypothetical protein